MTISRALGDTAGWALEHDAPRAGAIAVAGWRRRLRWCGDGGAGATPGPVSVVAAGVDLVEVPRLRALWERYGTALERRLCTEAEIADLPGAPAARALGLARRFGIKECLIKAVGGLPPGGRFVHLETRLPAGLVDAGARRVPAGHAVLHGPLAPLVPPGAVIAVGDVALDPGEPDTTDDAHRLLLSWAAVMQGGPDDARA